MQEALLQQCVQDYLVKPFSVEELHARLAHLVTMKKRQFEQLRAQNDDLRQTGRRQARFVKQTEAARCGG